MALINCSSCGRQVSDELSSCSYCGYELSGTQSIAREARAPNPYSPPALWFAVENGARKGPWNRTQIDEQLAAGRLGPSSLVWTEGMVDWEMASSALPAMDRIEKAATRMEVPSSASRPEIPSVPSVSGDAGGPAEALRSPRPVTRWFARMVDIYFFAIVGSLLLTVLGLNDVLATDNNLTFGMAMVFLYIPIEAMLMSAFGKTPGKALLGIEVTVEGRKQLPFDVSFRRALNVWWSGLGIGFPLVTLFTMAHQREKILRQGATTYDTKAGILVRQRPLSDGQRFLVIVAALAIVVLAWFSVVNKS